MTERNLRRLNLYSIKRKMYPNLTAYIHERIKQGGVLVIASPRKVNALKRNGKEKDSRFQGAKWNGIP